MIFGSEIRDASAPTERSVVLIVKKSGPSAGPLVACGNTPPFTCAMFRNVRLRRHDPGGIFARVPSGRGRGRCCGQAEEKSEKIPVPEAGVDAVGR